MVSKTVLILMFVGACLAIPVEEFRQPVAALEPGSLTGSPGALIPQGVKPEDIDLTADASRWWRRSYYPTYPVYRRYYYNYPSVYSYHTPSFSYWNNHW